LGVPIGALREMAAEGEITADKMVRALERAATFVNDQFGTRIKTFDQSMVELTNSFTRFVGKAAQASGITQDMATAVSELSRFIDTLADGFATLTREMDAIRSVFKLLNDAANRFNAAYK